MTTTQAQSPFDLPGLLELARDEVATYWDTNPGVEGLFQKDLARALTSDYLAGVPDRETILYLLCLMQGLLYGGLEALREGYYDMREEEEGESEESDRQ